MDANTSAKRLAWGTGLVVFALALAWFFSFDEPWALRGENKTSLFPMTQDAWRQWVSGRFPAWTSGMWAGFPLFTGGQSAALYLPHAIPFASTPAPHWRAFDVALALHAGWLAAGFVTLLARLGARPLAAVFGVLLLLQAPHVVYWTNFLPCFVAFSWWPWLFLAAEELREGERPPLRGVVLGGVALAAQVLVGFVEFAFYSSVIASLWIVVGRSPVSFGRRVVRVSLLGASAASLSAPQLLPLLLDLGPTIRVLLEADLVLGLQAAEWTGLFDPFEREPGRGFGSIYLGVAPCVLAVLALVARARRAWLLAAMAIVAGLLAVGPATPLHGWLMALPGFALFRTPAKFFVITELAVLALAALGLCEFARRGAWRARGAWALAAVAFVEYAVHFTLQLAVVASPHVAHEVSVPSGLAATERFLPLLTEPDTAGGPPPRVYHVVSPGRYGSLSELYGIESLRGSPPALLSFQQAKLLNFRTPASLLERPWLRLTGVRYVLSAKPCTSRRERWLVAVEEHGGWCLLRNADSVRRFALLPRVRLVDDEASEAEQVMARPAAAIPLVLPSGSAGEGVDLAWQRAAAGASLERAEGVVARRYAPGHVVLEVRAARDRFLLVREARSAGWHARVDGRTVPVFAAGGIFFAVPVPAGLHEVELQYRVRGLGVGFGLAVCWVATVVFAARAGHRRSASALSVP